ncbi:unnamed protein product, partial [Vitis vinifera]
MPELKFSIQIVHHMLLRQCLIKKDDEMWFLVNSKGLRFGEDEFRLITGLSFGPIPQHNETSMRIRDFTLIVKTKCVMIIWRKFFFLLVK